MGYLWQVLNRGVLWSDFAIKEFSWWLFGVESIGLQVLKQVTKYKIIAVAKTRDNGA